MPTPVSIPTNTQPQRYGVPTVPPPRSQPYLPKLPPYDRPTSTDNYPCTDPSPRPRTTTHEIHSVRVSPRQNSSQQLARYTTSPSRSSQPSALKSQVNPFTLTQGVYHRAPGPNFKFHQFTNPLDINTDHGVQIPGGKRINYLATPPQRMLKPTASTCSLGKLENKYVEEGRDEHWNAYIFPSTPLH